VCGRPAASKAQYRARRRLGRARRGSLQFRLECGRLSAQSTTPTASMYLSGPATSQSSVQARAHLGEGRVTHEGSRRHSKFSRRKQPSSAGSGIRACLRSRSRWRRPGKPAIGWSCGRHTRRCSGPSKTKVDIRSLPPPGQSSPSRRNLSAHHSARRSLFQPKRLRLLAGGRNRTSSSWTKLRFKRDSPRSPRACSSFTSLQSSFTATSHQKA